jgi:hypothetical protein
VSGFSFLWQNSADTQLNKIDLEEDQAMANQVTQEKPKIRLSLDGWAVGIALLLAALVKLGALKHVGW